LKTAIIIPAYNEASRLGRVLEALDGGRWDVLVVNDGSTDDTAAIARGFPRVRLLNLAANAGKGAALWAGAQATRAELLVFLDADLRGLQPEHVDRLLAPLAHPHVEMSVGVFRGGRGQTDFSHWLTPWVSGQRAVRRSTLLSVDRVPEARMGVEALLTRTAEARGWGVRYVPLAGVSHVMKEEKLGPLAGLRARWRMYGEMWQAWRGPCPPPVMSVDFVASSWRCASAGWFDSANRATALSGPNPEPDPRSG